MLAGIVCLIITMLTVYQRDVPMIALGLMIPLLALVSLLFYNLTIVVSRETVAFSFGTGLIRRSYKIDDIESCSPVNNKWWHGWGIHFAGNTTIYNVSGMKAIELKFKGKKRTVRIGTDEPEKLSQYINELIEKRIR
jgi:hypothetical protein